MTERVFCHGSNYFKARFEQSSIRIVRDNGETDFHWDEAVIKFNRRIRYFPLKCFEVEALRLAGMKSSSFHSESFNKALAKAVALLLVPSKGKSEDIMRIWVHQ